MINAELLWKNKPEVLPNREMASLVDALCSINHGLDGGYRKGQQHQSLPSQEVIREVLETLRSIIFPGYFGFSHLKKDSIHFHIGSALDRVQPVLADQIEKGLCFACRDSETCLSDCTDQAQAIVTRFLQRLPAIQELLMKDACAAYEGDPAAHSLDEVIFCYPGLLALTNFRLAHELFRLDVPFIPRMITEQAHSITGIDIHPGAEIGESFFIDHGAGVVIGETSIIGDRVRIYQGVTLGAKSFQKDEAGMLVKGTPRHPILEDDVIVYSGATILGRVTIGRGSVIGGNVWLVNSVPPNSRITQAQACQSDFSDGAGI
ncbi:MAG: Serine acetyltransferase [Syntrophus sp. PtaU1.Bin208]|nr:MAG: Serine acetyltransferase [Syntrophus sp. PtaU1.Bin208]